MQTLHRPDTRNEPTCGSFPAVRSAWDRTSIILKEAPFHRVTVDGFTQSRRGQLALMRAQLLPALPAQPRELAKERIDNDQE